MLKGTLVELLRRENGGGKPGEFREHCESSLHTRSHGSYIGTLPRKNKTRIEWKTEWPVPLPIRRKSPAGVDAAYKWRKKRTSHCYVTNLFPLMRSDITWTLLILFRRTQNFFVFTNFVFSEVYAFAWFSRLFISELHNLQITCGRKE